MDKFVIKLTKTTTVASVDVVPQPPVVVPVPCASSVNDQQTTPTSSGRTSGGRSYQKAWEKTYHWIQYDESVDKVFCGTCKEGVKMKAALPTATIGDKSAILAFVTEGFGAWKKAISRFQTHEKSALHAAATIACVSVAQGVNVHTQLSVGKLKEMKDARVSLLKIISTIKFLAMQGLALRGHTDEKSNFMQLLLLRSQDVPELRTWLERSKYKWTSHDIMNEILSLLAKQVERNILQLIKNSEYFAVIADETADISVKEQLSICFRVVDESFKIHELFMGFYETAETNADTLFKIIQDVLMRFSLPIQSCRGQCYDGAANVSGEVSGVQARFRDVEPKALYVHCTAHTLNLVVQDSMQCIEKIRDFLMFMRELITFVRNSPKRLSIFKAFQDDDSRSLRPFCPTRWCLRIKSLTMLESNYQTIITFLREIHLTGKGDTAAKANGFLSKLLEFETYYFTLLMISVFSKVEILNSDLQSTSLHFQMARSKIDTMSTAIEELRREGYSAIWEKSLSRAHELDLEEPKLPRIRKIPRRLDEGSAAHIFRTAEDYYKIIFIQVLDQTTSSLKNRFQQRVIDHMVQMEQFATSNIDGEEVKRFYKEDFDVDRLVLHRDMFLDIARSIDLPVNSIKSAIDILSDPLRNHIPSLISEYVRFLKTLLTVPVTSCTAERSFSGLRRLKTYLRSTMGQERLNDIAILNVHRDVTDNVDIDDIAGQFIDRTVVRRNTFYKT